MTVPSQALVNLTMALQKIVKVQGHLLADDVLLTDHDFDALTQEIESAIAWLTAVRVEVIHRQPSYRCDLHDANDHFHCETCGLPVWDHDEGEHDCPEGFKGDKEKVEWSTQGPTLADLRSLGIDPSFRPTDISFRDERSIFILTGVSEHGLNWLNENLKLEGWQAWGTRSYAVEHRYVDSILIGAYNDGLIVSNGLLKADLR